MKNSFLKLFLIYNIFTYAQTIKGTITAKTGIVPFATVLIKENQNIIEYTNANELGYYKISVNKNIDSLSIEITSLSYEPKIIFLSELKILNNEIKLDIKLEDRVTNLKEVLIEKKRAITQKKDTLEYNPDSFKDGTDRVVEDLLRKLPGIKVEENGEIKYKGKSIKKMLLDGDDLFDSNYTIGSKNINVEMIDKVQGIDHYEENSLLKGIRDSDEVAINLVLKKGKTDFSGNTTLGYGIEERYYGTISGVVVNKKIKGFGISSYNNIGQNNTPYDFSSDIISLENNKNSNIYSKSLLNEGNFNSLLDNEFHRLNRNFYTSLNTLNKVYNRSSIKVNAGIYNDQLSRFNQSSSTITLENTNFTISEFNNQSKRPQLYDLNIHFSNKEKENFHWEYLGKINYNTSIYKDESSNNNFIQSNRINSENLNSNHSVNTTYKISENDAVVSSFLFSKSKSPQNLVTNPPTIIDEINSLFAQNQISEFKKDFYSLTISYLKSKNNFKYAVHSKFSRTNNNLKSTLLNTNGQSLGTEFENNLSYVINSLNFAPVIVYNSKKYSFKVSLNMYHNYVDFRELSSNIIENDLFITPKFTAIYKFNSNSNASFNYTFNQILPDEDKVFTGTIQTNYRNFLSNDFSLEYLKTHNYILSYNYNNFLNLTQFSADLTYSFRPNNYYVKNLINQNISVANQFFANVGNKDYGINISGEKYFHPLRTTFQMNTSFDLSFDNNIVNGSDFRTITSQNFTLNFTARRSIKKIVIIENKTFYVNSSFSVKNEGVTNKFEMLTNQSKLILKPNNNFKASIIGNFICPNLKDNNNYFFLESELSYSPKAKNTTYSLLGKNLTNNKLFTTTNVSDFAININSHNLIERYVMFKFSFGF